MKKRHIYRLIPAQWLAHFADEWMFGFPDWSTRHFETLAVKSWLVFTTAIESP